MKSGKKTKIMKKNTTNMNKVISQKEKLKIKKIKNMNTRESTRKITTSKKTGRNKEKMKKRTGRTKSSKKTIGRRKIIKKKRMRKINLNK